MPSSFSIRLKLALSLQAFSRRSLPSSEDGLGQQPGRAGAVAVSAAGQLAVNAVNGFHRNQGPQKPKMASLIGKNHEPWDVDVRGTRGTHVPIKFWIH